MALLGSALFITNSLWEICLALMLCQVILASFASVDTHLEINFVFSSERRLSFNWIILPLICLFPLTIFVVESQMTN